jgi:hypothetical protein
MSQTYRSNACRQKAHQAICPQSGLSTAIQNVRLVPNPEIDLLDHLISAGDHRRK